MTIKNTMSKQELQDEVRKLRLENQGYRVFGTPMEIMAKINYQPPVCYWCQFQISDRSKCAMLSRGADRYWLHHECFEDGFMLIKEMEKQNG